MREFVRRLVIGITEICLFFLLIVGGTCGYYIGEALVKSAYNSGTEFLPGVPNWFIPSGFMTLGILVSALVNSLYYILLDIRANTKQSRDSSRAILELYRNQGTGAAKIQFEPSENQSRQTEDRLISELVKESTEEWIYSNYKDYFTPFNNDSAEKCASFVSEKISAEVNRNIRLQRFQVIDIVYSMCNDNKLYARYNIWGNLSEIRVK